MSIPSKTEVLIVGGVSALHVISFVLVQFLYLQLVVCQLILAEMVEK